MPTYRVAVALPANSESMKRFKEVARSPDFGIEVLERPESELEGAIVELSGYEEAVHRFLLQEWATNLSAGELRGMKVPKLRRRAA